MEFDYDKISKEEYSSYVRHVIWRYKYLHLGVELKEERKIIGPGLDKICKGKGCKVCNGTGYKGRRSIHEMVIIDKKLRRLIADGADNDDMYEYATKEQGMKTLYEAAIDLVREGITTPEEVLKVSYNND